MRMDPAPAPNRKETSMVLKALLLSFILCHPTKPHLVESLLLPTFPGNVKNSSLHSPPPAPIRKQLVGRGPESSECILPTINQHGVWGALQQCPQNGLVSLPQQTGT